MERCNLFNDGNFFIGVNYWASNAGTNMWNQWDEDVVKRDLDLLIEANVKVVRMFPLWSDFQPIKMLYGGNHQRREIAFSDMPAPHSKEMDAGIDAVMADRFERFLDLAEERGIKVMVGLLTGWMSGTLYAPRALEALNLYNDPTALKWEMKFIKYMVSRFKTHNAIVAWDIGNECNCMDMASSVDEAYTWSLLLANAIRAEDSERPIISGMHGLDPNGVWRPQDQGEIMDVLCTHPYPAFTAHCDTDPVNRMKSANHAVAESLYYAGIGQKPCFAEEINTLGPMFANEDITSANADMALFGLWAHNCFGYMWWCACNQSALDNIPYDWNALERELGLIRADGTHVKMLDRMTAFSHFTERFGKLPVRKTDAVAILVRNQDSWATAYGTFLLAKQAGIEMNFAYLDMDIPKADAYFLPSLSLYGEPTKHLMKDLLSRVENDGATLYISMDGGMMSEFSDVTGFELVSKSRATETAKTTLSGKDIELYPEFLMTLKAQTAETLASDQNGNPVFGVKNYGKGKVYFLNSPIEYLAATRTAIIDGVNHQPYYEFYKAMGIKNGEKIAEKQSAFVGLTEHKAEDCTYLAIINYLPEECEEEITLSSGKAVEVQSVDGNVTITETARGFKIKLPANCGGVVTVR